MKEKDELRELRNLEADELEKRSRDTRHELMNLRFRKASGQLEQTTQLNMLRRRIARIETLLREKQL